MLNGIDRFEGRSTLKTWLFRILTNRAKTRGERESRSVPFSSIGDPDEPAVDPDSFRPEGDQYPGGWMADHSGRRRAFSTLLAAASTGYLIYLFSPSWPFLFLGLAFTMAWQSMASPSIFATIGDALPKIGEPSRKAMIVDFADAQTRARTVGLYYLVRSLSITPASAIGGL